MPELDAVKALGFVEAVRAVGGPEIGKGAAVPVCPLNKIHEVAMARWCGGSRIVEGKPVMSAPGAINEKGKGGQLIVHKPCKDGGEPGILKQEAKLLIFEEGGSEAFGHPIAGGLGGFREAIQETLWVHGLPLWVESLPLALLVAPFF